MPFSLASSTFYLLFLLMKTFWDFAGRAVTVTTVMVDGRIIGRIGGQPR
jgi:hypothetical protein